MDYDELQQVTGKLHAIIEWAIARRQAEPRRLAEEALAILWPPSVTLEE